MQREGSKTESQASGPRGDATQGSDSVFDALKKLYSLLSRPAKRNGLILVGLMIVGAFFEVAGVAAIPAFVSIMMSPDDLANLPVVGELMQPLAALEGTELVIWTALALVVIYGLKNAFLVFNFRCQANYVTNRRNDLGCRLTEAYMQAPYTFHLGRNTSELLRNVDREINIIAYQVLGAVLEICTRAVILISVLILLLVVEPWITLFWMLIFGCIAALCLGSVSARLKRAGLEEQAQRKILVQALYQGFGCIKESRILNREGYFSERIGESIRRMSSVFKLKLFIGKAVSPITEFLAVTALLILAVSLVLLGRPTESIFATLSLFVVGLVRLRETTSAVITHMTALRYNYVSVAPVHADLTRLETRASEERQRSLPTPCGLERKIELRDVWYRYNEGEGQAVREIDIEIPAGSAVGFVGSTGAGKSTLVDILLGLLEPQRGGVFVDGVDIREIGLGSWQRSIGYVPQSIYLLDDTIRRNIALGQEDEEVDEVALWTAIRAAQLEGFVSRQFEGVETVIGENGVRLSGGERQRIGIARALYHDPQVLVLDEATSSLDNATERAVVAAVEALRGQRTIVMIAHRLSTVRDCDRLYFLKGGKVEAEGSYAELKDSHEDFRLMAAG